MSARLILISALFTAACGAAGSEFTYCTQDEDCGAGLVCFADGCGDPGQNIAVELLASTSSGEYPQDRIIGQLRPNEELLVHPPPFVRGALLRSTATYAGGVSVQLAGESLIIPGQVRNLTATVAPAAGQYAIPVGTGRYTLSATPEDPTVPPTFVDALYVEATVDEQVDLVFPGASDVQEVRGRIVQSALSGLPVDGVTLQIQAFDALTQTAISQRATAEATGDFVLHVKRVPDALNPYVLRVRPKEAGAFVPQKEFRIESADDLLSPLELGNYGVPVTYFGRLISEDTRPIAGASVYVQGPVGGSGTFRSPTVQTNANGEFLLTTLPSANAVPFTIWAVPPAGSHSGVLRGALEVPEYGAVSLTFVAPDKVRVTGTVLRPDGSFASGVRVAAVPITSLDDAPLPTLGAEARTDLRGRYELLLDPAVYRLDFVPGEQLPRNSRILRVVTYLRPREQEVSPFTLSRGRTAQGVVKLAQRGVAAEDLPPAPLTSVRFFRLVLSEGTQTSQLLGEAVTDELGRYSITLPARTSDDP